MIFWRGKRSILRHIPPMFLSKRVCVDEIQTPATRKVCVDEIQTPATRKVCVGKMKTPATRKVCVLK